MRRAAALLITLLIGGVGPALAHDEGPVPNPFDLTAIEGSVLDRLGDPVSACVFADPVGVPAVAAGPLRSETLTDAEGAYILFVVPGDYDLYVYEPVPEGDDVCPHPNALPARETHFDRAGPIRTSSLDHDPVDVVVDYTVSAGAPRYPGEPPDVGAPGDTVAVSLATSNALRGRAVARWEAPGLGVALTPPYQGTHTAVLDRYHDPAAPGFTVPDVPDGAYAVNYWVEDSSGTVLTAVRHDTFWVDSVAPVITATTPTEGAVVDSQDPISAFVTDPAPSSPHGVKRVTLELWEVATDSPLHLGSITRVDTGHWTRDPGGMRRGYEYTATFTATDWAGHSHSVGPIHFWTAP